jgi:hypothetical protein
MENLVKTKSIELFKIYDKADVAHAIQLLLENQERQQAARNNNEHNRNELLLMRWFAEWSGDLIYHNRHSNLWKDHGGDLEPLPVDTPFIEIEAVRNEFKSFDEYKTNLLKQHRHLLKEIENWSVQRQKDTISKLRGTTPEQKKELFKSVLETEKIGLLKEKMEEQLGRAYAFDPAKIESDLSGYSIEITRTKNKVRLVEVVSITDDELFDRILAKHSLAEMRNERIDKILADD